MRMGVAFNTKHNIITVKKASTTLPGILMKQGLKKAIRGSQQRGYERTSHFAILYIRQRNIMIGRLLHAFAPLTLNQGP